MKTDKTCPKCHKTNLRSQYYDGHEGAMGYTCLGCNYAWLEDLSDGEAQNETP